MSPEILRLGGVAEKFKSGGKSPRSTMTKGVAIEKLSQSEAELLPAESEREAE
jgi:hypothetical protein